MMAGAGARRGFAILQAVSSKCSYTSTFLGGGGWGVPL